MKIARCTLRKWATTTTTATRSARSSVVAFPTFSSTTASSSSSPVVTNNFLRTAIISNNNHPTFNCRRPFSSESTKSSSKSALLEILAREEQEEAEIGNTELPTELLELKTTIEESWKIVEDGATTDLYKITTSNNAKIQVSFHCQDTIEAVDVGELDYGDEDDDANDEVLHEEEDNEEDFDDEGSSPVRFTATVTKAGNSLVFACFSELGQVRIEGVSTTAKSTPEFVHENQGTLPKIEYQGPDYTELAEDLQESLAAYLDEECGVNSDVATFIAMFTDYREEIQYVDFLKQAQSIVS